MSYSVKSQKTPLYCPAGEMGGNAIYMILIIKYKSIKYINIYNYIKYILLQSL